MSGVRRRQLDVLLRARERAARPTFGGKVLKQGGGPCRSSASETGWEGGPGARGLKVMGVDPGVTATGFGVLTDGPGGMSVVEAGVINTAATESLEARLEAIHAAVHRIIKDQAPGLVIVEDLYTEYKFPRTAVLMGHARGVIYLAARQQGVAVLALSPAEVKRAVTGNGSAGKFQVQRAVQTLLGLASLPRPSHVADALGLAVTGMARAGGRLGASPVPFFR